MYLQFFFAFAVLSVFEISLCVLIVHGECDQSMKKETNVADDGHADRNNQVHDPSCCCCKSREGIKNDDSNSLLSSLIPFYRRIIELYMFISTHN